MKKTAKNTALLTCLGTSLLFLPSCVTSNTSAYQPTLTQASMVTNSASCQEIAYNIEAMDRIMIDTGYGQTSGYSNYSGHYAGQAVNTGLRASGAAYKAPYAGSIVSMATSTYSQSAAQSQQMKNRAGMQANQQKSRLINLYQQKQC